MSLLHTADPDGKNQTPVSAAAPLPTTRAGLTFATLTTTPLAANGVYTSPSIDIGPSPSLNTSIVIIGYADQNGTYLIEESDDAVTWYTLAAGVAVGVNAANNSFTVAGRYHRLTYTNGGTIQTKFRLAYALRN